MDKPNILFFLGKGGVGKSTLSAAAALQLAQSGRDVHLLSLDPAHNLGDLFGAKKSKFRPHQNLLVEEINPAGETAAYLREVRDEAKSRFRYWDTLGLDLAGMVNLLKESPGVEEYALLRALQSAAMRLKKNGLLVVDTPPTALALRILALPGMLKKWTDRLSAMRGRILKERFSLHRLSGGRSTIAGFTEEEDPVSGRLTSLQGGYGSLNRQLKSGSCRIYVIDTPARLAEEEAKRILSTLKKSGFRPGGLIRNRSADPYRPDHGLPCYSVPENALPHGPEGLGRLPLDFILKECSHA